MPDFELGNVGSGESSLRAGIHELHKRLRIGISERFQQYRVDDGEDGCVCPDSNRDNQNGDDGKARHLDERAHRKAEIAPCVIDPGQGIVAPHLIPCALWIAKLQAGLAATFFLREAAGAVGILFVCQVRFDFLGEVGVFFFAMHEAAKTHGAASENYSGDSPRIRPMARVMLRQRLVSAVRCFRPFAVSW